MKSLFFYYTFSILLTCFVYNQPNGAEAAVGINYGLLGDNLPPPSTVVSQLQQIGVDKIRIFDPNNEVLTALHDSGISVIVGTTNADLQSLASDPSAATAWVATNILPHKSSLTFTCIVAGNEVFPSDLTQYIPVAMQNLQSSLKAQNLDIPVSTAIEPSVLAASYPPSSGVFRDAIIDTVKFLTSNKYPLLVNVHPYFPRVSNPNDVTLEYALFQSPGTVVQDGPYGYQNIFEAILDAVYTALEKAGASDVEIIVSETGWPSAGGADASVENAQTYVNSLIEHVSSGAGTPKRPGKAIETYIFALFNENQKPAGFEQHWGLYDPDLTPVYPVNHF